MKWVVVLAALAAWLNMSAASAQPVGPVPADIRAEFGIVDPWYAKYLDADGIPIVGSENVSDAELRRAQSDAIMLMRTSPVAATDILRARRNRIVILGLGETVRHIPEFAAAYPDDEHDDRYWGGFGSTASLPITAGTEVNIMRGHGAENVFIHEFGHTVGEQALALLDPSFQAELDAAYAHARALGLWRRTYANVSAIEYWAEGVQSYFNANKEGPRGGDGVHNDVNSRVELAVHDVWLFVLIDRIYRLGSQ